MSAPQSVGTSVTSALFFNTAILTINGLQIGEIQDVTLNKSYTMKKFNALNSIVPRAIRRSNFEAGVSFNIAGSLYREIEKTFFSSSSPVSGGLKYTVKDGQQTAATMLLTAYENDDTTKSIQIEVTNATIVSANETSASQEFQTFAVEVACTQINKYIDTTLSN